MIGNGLMGTLLTIRGIELGYSTGTISFIQLGYPAGALLGTMFVPRIIMNVGHIRSFSALASICSVAAVVHLMTTDVTSWFAMRLVAGICFPGLYVITESWLNARAENTNRAQLLSIYFITQSLGSAAGVWMAGLNEVSGANLFGFVSILLSLSIVPLLLSAGSAPPYSAPERMSLAKLFHLSPMALLGALLSGIVAGALFVALPIYALLSGASAAVASTALALATLAGALAFFPAGWLSDRTDRRNVVGLLALVGMALALLEAVSPEVIGFIPVFALFAAATTPLYAICLAHGNDMLRPSQFVPASGAMVFVQNIGILIGAAFGPLSTEIGEGRGYPALLAGALMILVLVTLRRRLTTDAPDDGPDAVAAAGVLAPQTGQLNAQVAAKTARRSQQED